MAVETGDFRIETDLGATNLNIQNFKLELEEDGNPTNRIIHIPGPGDPPGTLSFKMRWEMTGDMIEAALLAGDLHWHARVYFEQIGPDNGPAPKFGTFLPIVQGPGSTPVPYTDTINFSTADFSEGVYKYVVTLNMYKVNHPISIIHSYFQADHMLEAVTGF